MNQEVAEKWMYSSEDRRSPDQPIYYEARWIHEDWPDDEIRVHEVCSCAHPECVEVSFGSEYVRLPVETARAISSLSAENVLDIHEAISKSLLVLEDFRKERFEEIINANY